MQCINRILSAHPLWLDVHTAGLPQVYLLSLYLLLDDELIRQKLVEGLPKAEPCYEAFRAMCLLQPPRE